MAQTIWNEHPEWRTTLLEGLGDLTDGVRRPVLSIRLVGVLVAAVAVLGWAL